MLVESQLQYFQPEPSEVRPTQAEPPQSGDNNDSGSNTTNMDTDFTTWWEAKTVGLVSKV